MPMCDFDPPISQVRIFGFAFAFAVSYKLAAVTFVALDSAN